MADGINFGGVDLSGLNFDLSKQANLLGDMPMSPPNWQLAAEAAEQRNEQAELLARLIERQDAIVKEQRRQAEEQREAARGSKAREIAVIVLTAIGILVTVSLAVAPAVISILAR